MPRPGVLQYLENLERESPVVDGQFVILASSRHCSATHPRAGASEEAWCPSIGGSSYAKPGLGCLARARQRSEVSQLIVAVQVGCNAVLAKVPESA